MMILKTISKVCTHEIGAVFAFRSLSESVKSEYVKNDRGRHRVSRSERSAFLLRAKEQKTRWKLMYSKALGGIRNRASGTHSELHMTEKPTGLFISKKVCSGISPQAL